MNLNQGTSGKGGISFPWFLRSICNGTWGDIWQSRISVVLVENGYEPNRKEALAMKCVAPPRDIENTYRSGLKMNILPGTKSVWLGIPPGSHIRGAVLYAGDKFGCPVMGWIPINIVTNGGDITLVWPETLFDLTGFVDDVPDEQEVPPVVLMKALRAKTNGHHTNVKIRCRDLFALCKIACATKPWLVKGAVVPEACNHVLVDVLSENKDVLDVGMWR